MFVLVPVFLEGTLCLFHATDLPVIEVAPEYAVVSRGQSVLINCTSRDTSNVLWKRTGGAPVWQGQSTYCVYTGFCLFASTINYLTINE